MRQQEANDLVWKILIRNACRSFDDDSGEVWANVYV